MRQGNSTNVGNNVAWAVSGALFGFGFIALASIGIFVMIASLGIAVPLLVQRVSGSPWFLVGAGVTFSAAWLSLMIDPNAPDDRLGPLIVGMIITCVGLALARTSRKRATD